jgi:hypothetical protein
MKEWIGILKAAMSSSRLRIDVVCDLDEALDES